MSDLKYLFLPLPINVSAAVVVVGEPAAGAHLAPGPGLVREPAVAVVLLVVEPAVDKVPVAAVHLARGREHVEVLRAGELQAEALVVAQARERVPAAGLRVVAPGAVVPGAVVPGAVVPGAVVHMAPGLGRERAAAAGTGIAADIVAPKGPGPSGSFSTYLTEELQLL